jgi:5,10-methylenetetrahydrofolate reductase
VTGPSVLDRLSAPGPLVSVELRPPRTGLSSAESMDLWIDLHQATRRLARHDTVMFLTDNAVGVAEEENLRHLAANLATDMSRSQVVPFLTCKHTLDYCHLYAARAHGHGFEALTVLGGDHTVGPPRCVAHAWELREQIRRRIPGLVLGGWANPHRDAAEQAAFIESDDYSAEFLLTQVVSHHSVGRVSALLEELDRRGIEKPVVFGVFLYRSANPRTLAMLGDFFPVPSVELAREFEEGASPEEVCARSIRALRNAGADKVYISNLGFRDVAKRYEMVLSLL